MHILHAHVYVCRQKMFPLNVFLSDSPFEGFNLEEFRVQGSLDFVLLS